MKDEPVSDSTIVIKRIAGPFTSRVTYPNLIDNTNMREIFQPPASDLPAKVKRYTRWTTLSLWLTGGGPMSPKEMEELKVLDEEFKDVITADEEEE